MLALTEDLRHSWTSFPVSSDVVLDFTAPLTITVLEAIRAVWDRPCTPNIAVIRPVDDSPNLRVYALSVGTVRHVYL